jgi:hypothetical protein
VISTRQWSLLAGIAKMNVSEAAMVTPHNIPTRICEPSFFLSFLLLYNRSLPSCRFFISAPLIWRGFGARDNRAQLWLGLSFPISS